MIGSEDLNRAIAAISAGQTFDQSGLPATKEAMDFWNKLSKEIAEMKERGQSIDTVSEIAESDPRPINASAIMSMPDIADVKFPSMIGAMPSAPRRRKKPTHYRGVTLGRQPTDFEAHVLSLSEIPHKFDAEVSAAVETLAEMRLSNLGSTPTREMMAILLSAQNYMARYGAFEMRRECARQGLHLTIGDAETDVELSDEDHSLCLTAAETAVKALSSEWDSIVSAASLSARRARKTFTREMVQEKAVISLKSQVRGLLNMAFSLGRRAQMRYIALHAEPMNVISLRTVDEDEAEELVDYVIQTAVMDQHTCEPCADADGLTFEYDDDEMLEHQPPYYLCDGGDRCRCVQVYVLKNGGYWTVREGKIK